MSKNNYPKIQRQGISMFWDNNWFSKNKNKKLIFSILQANIVLYNLLLNFIKYRVINRLFINNYKNKFLIINLLKKKRDTRLYIGNIFILKTNSTIIININYTSFFRKEIFRSKKVNINILNKNINSSFII